jgi:acetylornithine deacetylase/succinyl-diaminopimelate desuccinylase-like protein
MPAMTRMTVTPTGVQTFEPPNVIPPFVDVICDCRALAGQSPSDIRQQVSGALGNKLRYELELLEPLEGGTESPIDSPLYRMLEQYVAERLPGAILLPVISAGFSDSHWVRSEHGTVAYGFAPLLSLDADAYGRAAHGADESIEVADLVEMAEFHLRAVRAEYPSEPT